MAEKIHPNSNHPTGNPKFPATKAQLRPLYHPQALRHHRTRRRSCCCSCCLWITFTILLLLTIAAAAGGVFYVMYHPRRPSFTVSSVKVSRFDIASDNELNTRFNFTLTARNPNDDITFVFDWVSVKFDSKGVDVGDGSIPAFVLHEKNVARLRTVVVANGRVLDDDRELKLDLKKRRVIMVRIEFDTKMKVKILVVCWGIRFAPPGGKLVAMADTSDVKCDVDVRVRIWRWTI
ncbi:NDR1/HIN1-like protein 13 [Bidens hawaiensis]|uniref:NDR1/HIN1-like protein 13 n=1 Tax=Bidens hawaiensis TaxID=980011 RepID=UPI00404B1406